MEGNFETQAVREFTINVKALTDVHISPEAPLKAQ